MGWYYGNLHKRRHHGALLISVSSVAWKHRAGSTLGRRGWWPEMALRLPQLFRQAWTPKEADLKDILTQGLWSFESVSKNGNRDDSAQPGPPKPHTQPQAELLRPAYSQLFLLFIPKSQRWKNYTNQNREVKEGRDLFQWQLELFCVNMFSHLLTQTLLKGWARTCFSVCLRTPTQQSTSRQFGEICTHSQNSWQGWHSAGVKGI